MRHAMASAIVALGDTVKTSMGVLSIPKGARRIVGLWGHAVGGAGNTTLENVTGIMEFESDSLKLQPMQFPLDSLAVTGTLGSAGLKPTVWPVNIPDPGNTDIECFMTLDLAQTIANTGRWGLIYEG